jgi:hypothetical protein
MPVETGGRLTPAMVNDAINEGYIELAREAGCFPVTISDELIADTARYAVRGDLAEISGVSLDGIPLDPITLGELQQTANWQTAPSCQPTGWYRANAFTIGLYPPPDDAYTLEISGYQVPSDEAGGIPLLAQDADLPKLPMPFRRLPAYYAVWQLAATVFPDDPIAAAAGAASLAQYRAGLENLKASLVVDVWG